MFSLSLQLGQVGNCEHPITYGTCSDGMSQNLQSAQELPKSSLGLGCVHHLAVSWPAQDSKSSCFSSCYVQLSRWLTLLLTVEAVSDCTQNVSKAWGITGRVDFEQIQVEPSKYLRCWDFLSFCLFHPLSFPFNLSPFLSPPIPSSLRKPFCLLSPALPFSVSPYPKIIWLGEYLLSNLPFLP